MTAKPAVLVTRPEEQADPLCAALGSAGFRATRQPLLAVEPLVELAAEHRRCVLELDHYQHCIFVSSNAARFGLDRLLDYWPQWPVGVRCYAVGDSTAAVLRAAALEVMTPGLEMTSEGLLALAPLTDIAGDRVMIVKGEGGRRALAEVLGERGARVDEVACYRRATPEVDAQALQQRIAAENVGVALISSGEGLSNLSALLQPRENTKLSALVLIVPSSRIADEAHAAGWRQVVTAANATDGAMLGALVQWWSTEGETGE